MNDKPIFFIVCSYQFSTVMLFQTTVVRPGAFIKGTRLPILAEKKAVFFVRIEIVLVCTCFNDSPVVELLRVSVPRARGEPKTYFMHKTPYSARGGIFTLRDLYEAAGDGRLKLTWTCAEGERGAQVAELWLIATK